MTETRLRRRLAAILAADVVGYSRLMGADEPGTLAAMRRVWAELFNPAVAAHRGRVVKLMGDGALVEFASAVDAAECAVAIQRAMAGDGPIRFRIGVNLGDVVIEGDDILGDGVNVAARLEALAPEGGILLSDAIRAQIRGKIDLDLVDAGELELKNIDAPVRAWRWSEGGAGTPAASEALRAPEDQPSIAVMPFANMSGDPAQEVFADGLVDDIITTLSKLAGLRVVARNSTFVYKGRAVDVREAAHALSVRYVLEGSVRSAANRIRITTQLIDATTGANVWAERYDRALDDIFALQDEITLVLATEMQVRLTEGEQARLRYTTTSNVEAWTHWAQGLAWYREPVTEENTANVLACWKRALELDPDSATLNAMIGFKHYSDARFGWWDDRDTALAKAQAYADRAFALEPDNPDAHVTTSVIRLVQRRFDMAAEHARRAVRAAPGSADVASLACFVLAFAGHPDEAIAHGERAMILSPHCPAYYHGQLGNAYRLAGRLEQAEVCFAEFDVRSPGFGLIDLVILRQRSGRTEEAQRTAKRLLSIRRDFTIAAWADTQFRADADGLAADLAALRQVGLPEG